MALSGDATLQAFGEGATGNKQASFAGIACEIVVDQHPGMPPRRLTVSRPALFDAKRVKDALQPLHVGLRQRQALCRSQWGHPSLPQGRIPARTMAEGRRCDQYAQIGSDYYRIEEGGRRTKVDRVVPAA